MTYQIETVRIQGKIDALTIKIDHIDGGISDIKPDARDLRKEVRGNLLWLFGVMISVATVQTGVLLALLRK